MRSPASLVLLALLALVATPVAAQTTGVPVLVEDVDDAYAPRAIEGEVPVEVTWRLLNLNRQTPFYVAVTAQPGPGWDLEPADRFFLQPLEARNVSLRLSPAGLTPDRTAFTVTFSLVDSDTGTVTTVERRVELVVASGGRVFGLFSNPLPPPLDNLLGSFLLEMLVWVMLAVAAVAVGDTVVRAVASRAPSATVATMLRRLRWPIFLALLVVGVSRSVRKLSLAGLSDPAAQVLDAFAILLVAYVGYQVLAAILDYYAATVATRTETKIDDVLVPVFRKVGAVVAAVVALALIFQMFGWSANVVFGAAGIAGLVIAFAAQDTLSNFFSGVFLLLDRPFVEGDDIQIDTGEICRVDHVGLRSTRLYHGRNHETIILPNNHLATRRVVNLTRPDRRFRVLVDVGVAYGTDAPKTRAVLERTVRAHPDVVDDRDMAVVVFLSKLGESSVDWTISAPVREWRDRIRVASELRESILAAFAAEGIEIPFPHRTVIVRGADGDDEAAAAAAFTP